MTNPAPLLCPHCRYDLSATSTPNTHTTCPECGRSVIPMSPLERRRSFRRFHTHYLLTLFAPGLLLPLTIFTLYVINTPRVNDLGLVYLFTIPFIAIIWIPTTFVLMRRKTNKRNHNPETKYSLVLLFLYSIPTIIANVMLMLLIALMNSGA